MSHRKKYYPLEPRLLLDAAAVTTGAEVATDQVQLDDQGQQPGADRAEIDSLVAAFSDQPQQTRNEVAFIDSRIDQADQIAAGLDPSIQVVMLNADADGIAQISDVLSQYENLDAIHLFSHGSEGELLIGDSTLNTDSLNAQYQQQVAQWSAALSESADILVYGCDVAGGEKGVLFVEQLADLTQADIAASTDQTGSDRLGGDWVLETSVGAIESQVAAVNAFDGLLTTAPTIEDSANSTRQVTEDNSLAVTGLTVTDPDDAETMTVTIRVTDSGGDANSGTLTGTLTLASTTNLTNVTGDGTGAITFEGLVADVNNAINGMSLSSNADFNGDLRIAIEVDDGDQTGTLNVAVSVTAANDDPELATVPVSVAEGGTVAFTTTEFGLTDPDITSGDQETQQLIVQIDTLPSNGSLRFNGNPVAAGSVFSYDQVANLTYVHNDSDVVSGDTDSFTISVNDGAGGTTSGTININLTPVNKAPTISGSASIFEGEENVSVGLSVSDQESGHADALANSTIEIVSTDLNGEGTLYLDLDNDNVIDAGETLSAGDTFSADNQALVKFSHNGNETDTSDQPSFVVNVTDAGGGEGVGNELTSADTTITLDIVPVDDDPTLDANNDLSVAATNGANTIEGITTANLDVSDVDSVDNNLVYTMETRPSFGVVQVQVDGTWETLGIGGRFTQAQIDGGLVRYVHEVTITGDVTDNFTFSVRDSALKGFPDAGEEGAVRDINGDIEINTFTINITGVGGTQATPSDPSAGFGGTTGTVDDNATVPVADPGMTETNAALVPISEDGVGVLTTAMLNYDIESADGTYTVPADETVYTLTSLPPNGNVQLDSGGGVWVNIPAFGTFTQDDIDNGRVRFDHDGGEDFLSTFNYSVGDGGPNRIDSTFTLDIDPLNDKPVASGSSVEINEATPSADSIVRLTSSEVGMSDADLATDVSKRVGEGVQDNLWFRVTDLPADGQLQRWDGSSWTSVATNEWLSSDLLSMSADGATSGLRYVHDGGDQAANLTDSFNFEVRDDLSAPASSTEARTGQSTPTGDNVSDSATVSLSVVPVNDAPIVPLTSGAAGETIVDIDGNNDTSVNEALTVNEGGSGTITAASHLNAVDSDNNSVQRQFRITDAVDYGTLFNNGKALGVGSTFTQADIDANRITYTHNGSENFADSFQFVVSDGVATTATATFDINVTPTNDAPTLTTPETVQFFTAAAYDFTNTITIADGDLDSVATGETDFVQVTLDVQKSSSTYAGSTLTLGSTAGLTITQGTDGAAGGILVFQGTRADVQAALTNLTLQVPTDEDDTLSLEVTVDDRLRDASGNLTSGANGGTTNEDGSTINAANNSVTNTISIQASNSNDQPTIPSIPATATVNEDASFAFSGGNQIQIADVDAFDQDVTVTLSVTNGDLTLATTDLITAGANNSSTITLTGTVTDINTALLGLSYQGDSHFNGADTLNVSVDDGGNSGAGGAQVANGSVAITVTPVNDAPTLTVPGTQDFVSGASFVFSSGNGNAITVADANDVGQGSFNDDVEVTLAIDDGTLDLSGTAGLTVSGDGTNNIVLSGTFADVNAALDGLSYTPTNTNQDSTTTLTVTVSDEANGGTAVGGVGAAENANNTIEIQTSGVNDAPVVTAPTNPQSVDEDSTLTLTGAGNIFSFTDADDFGASNLVATVTATEGTLSLVSDDGATIGGDGTATLTITGTKAQINSALDGLQYTPDADYHGSAQITVGVNDAGNLGSGGAQSDSEFISVTVNPINDRPDASGTATLSAVNEDTADPTGTQIDTLITATHYSDATDDQTGAGGNDTSTNLGYIAIVGNASTAAQGTWQVSDGGSWIDVPTSGLSASAALVVAASEDIRFVPASDFHGSPGSLTVRLADSDGANTVNESTNNADLQNLTSNGGTGETGAWSTGSITVATSVTNVNDQPTGVDASLNAVDEDTSAPSGDTVANLFGSAFSDSTDDQTGVTGGADASSALGGIAIIGNSSTAGEGEWQYNTGSGWTAIPTGGLADSSAILLPTTASLRFVPASDFNGDPGDLSVRLADSSQTFSASTDISGSLTATDTWSNSVAFSTSVNAVNDAPTLSGTASNPVILENAGAGTGSGTLALINAASGGASDVDGGTASFGGGTITVSFTDGYQTGDTLSINGSPTGVDSTSGGSAADLVINLDADATEDTIGAILESIRYNSTSDNPTNFGNDTTRSYQITLNDGNNNGTAGGPAALNSSNNLTGTITFTTVDDVPTGVNDSGSVTEETDTSDSFNVISNDTDPDTQTLTVSAVEGVGGNVGSAVTGSYGSITVDSNGDATYTLTNSNADVQALGDGETLTETFTYTVTDGTSTDTATITITINGTNDAPVAVVDTDSTDEETDITRNAASGVLVNDSDTDTNDTITVTSITNGTDTVAFGNSVSGTNGGSFTINADGSYSFDPGTDFQSLAVGEDQTTAVTYTISDGNGGTDTATLTITVNGVNDDPTASTIPNQSDADNDSVNLDVTSYFADADTSDDLTYTATGLPSGLSIDLNTGVISGTIDNSASVSGPYTVEVTANDGNGGTVDSSFTWTVTNPAPTATNNTAAVTEETTLSDTGNVLTDDDGSGADSDPDGDTLVVSAVDGVAGDVGNSVTGTYGNITINSDGSFTYNLDNANADVQALADGETLTETFNYTVSDGEGGTDTATLTITVNGTNDSPTASTIPNQNNADNSVVNLDVTSYFSDADNSDDLTYTATGLPTGLSIDLNTGVISGTVDNSASVGGPYSVEITVSDSNGGSETSSFTWTVTNPAPTATNNSAAVTEESALSDTGNVLTDNDGSGTDSDTDGDTLVVSAIDGDAGDVGNAVTGTYGDITINSNGSYTYSLDNSNADVQALAAGETLTESFTYTVSDGEGGTDTATLTITINGTNDGPVATADTDSTDEESDLNRNAASGVLANDTDTDTNDSITVTSITNGTDTVAFGNAVAGTNGGSFTINADGSYSFTPGSDFQSLAAGESQTTTVTYTISDGNGGTDTATLTVTVNGVNDTPTASTIPNQTDTDSATVNLDVTSYFADTDATDVLTYTATGLPAGLSIDLNTGVITGTIDSAASVSGPYTVQITANDGNGGTVDTSFTWNVTNPAPSGTDNTASVTEETTLTDSGNVLTDNDGNGVDSDPDGDTLVVSAIDGVAGDVGNSVTGTYGDITINSDGSFTYSLDNSNADVQALATGETLTETFTYTVSDGQGGTDTATLTITVNGTNDAPTTTTIPNQTNTDNSSVSVNVSSFFADADTTDTLSYSATGLPTGLSIDTNTGLITGTIDDSASLAGPYTVAITASDGNGGMVTSDFTWNVTNPAPIGTNNTATVTEESALTDSGNVLTDDDGNGVDSDPDGDTIVVSAIEGSAGNVGSSVSGSYGDVTINSNGSYTYNLDNTNADVQALAQGETLTETFTYTVSDGEGGTDTATLTITINGTNDSPTAATIPDQNSDDASAVNLDITSYFNDTDSSDNLTYTATGLPPGLSLDLNTGVVSGTIDNSASQTGPFTVEITSDDGNGTSVSTTFTWNVANPAPNATDNTASVTEETGLSDSGNVISDDDGNGADSETDNDALVVSAVDGVGANVGNSVSGTYGDITIDSDGSYTYNLDNTNADVQALGDGDTLTESFTYTLSDGEGGTDTATITITVNGTNDAPTVSSISDQTSNDSESISLDVSGSFADTDSTDTLTFTATNLPPGLTIDPSTGIITGTITNDASQSGPFSTKVTATDTSGAAISTTFTWNVMNLTPVANDNSNVVSEDVDLTATGNVINDDDGTGIDSDPDGDTLFIDSVNGQPAGSSVPGTYGTIIVNANGEYTYSLDNDNADVQSLGSDETATDTFTYTLSDGQGGTTTAEIVIVINGNDEPVIELPEPEPTPPAPDPVTPPVVTPPSDGPSSGGGGSGVLGDTISDTLPALDEVATNDSLNDELLNPLSIRIVLEDKVVQSDKVHLFVLPQNTFQHTNPSESINVNVTLVDGSPLPNYITFDKESLSFEIDAPMAVEQGVTTVIIRVTGEDTSGNSASSTFTIVVLDQLNDEAPSTGVVNPSNSQPQLAEDEPVLETQQPSESNAEQPNEAETENQATDDTQAILLDTQELFVNQAQSSEGEIEVTHLQAQLDNVGRQGIEQAREQLLKDMKSLFS